MTSPEEIIKIADTRLEEAKLLLENKHYSGAFYLAGYSVELYLKAKICKVFAIPNLFEDKSKSKDKNNSEDGMGDIRKAVKIHKLANLLLFSGLKPKYDCLGVTNPKMLFNISFLIKEWNEQERYKPNNPIHYIKIENTLNNLKEFLEWIQNN